MGYAPGSDQQFAEYTTPHVLVIDGGYLGYGQCRQISSLGSKPTLPEGKPILFTTNKALEAMGRMLHDEGDCTLFSTALHYGGISGWVNLTAYAGVSWNGTNLSGRVVGVFERCCWMSCSQYAIKLTGTV